MTPAQKSLLERLVHAAQEVVYCASEQRMFYGLAQRIVRLDEIQSECFQFVNTLECSTDTSCPDAEKT